MTTPVWLLDIDGVLNAVGGLSVYRTKWPKAKWYESTMTIDLEPPWEFGNGDAVLLKVAGPVRDFIVEMHERDLAEIRWHTTWQSRAQRLANWLDLPTFPIHKAPEYLDGDRSGWWKLPAAKRVVDDEGRALLWTDDHIRYEVRPDHRLIEDPRNLVIWPDDRFGLSPDELTRIRIYLEKGQED